MKKLTFIFFTLLLAACATPQASADAQVPPTLTVPLTASPIISKSIETPTITPPPAQFEEIKWTAFSSRSNKLAIFASQPGQENGGSLCVYKIVNEQTFALEQLWGTTTDHEVSEIIFSPDGNRLVAVLDRDFIVWIDANNGAFLHVFRGNQSHFNPHFLFYSQIPYPLESVLKMVE
jgi:WD40 repeat protein